MHASACFQLSEYFIYKFNDVLDYNSELNLLKREQVTFCNFINSYNNCLPSC